ncbi:hypothetical protein [Leptospira alstonii]|uniref:Uncharacterized protein n=2 Tax=Leptospira alstonii TaxID=28452 RepID=M6CHE8_9LEPT|nr:hypothetical protein [Leptospira alstonii]EMJ91174.1 hypothetical protein LEP1GSC194_3452 [Leptospira alstonii serovar Sichuan str. 79601]EQA80578.1 hypothetical protein LEP1GSC193_3317 [Leptospira alstonii serovar Pingchang str. 80-412]
MFQLSKEWNERKDSKKGEGEKVRNRERLRALTSFPASKGLEN